MGRTQFMRGFSIVELARGLVTNALSSMRNAQRSREDPFRTSAPKSRFWIAGMKRGTDYAINTA